MHAKSGSTTDLNSAMAKEVKTDWQELVGEGEAAIEGEVEGEEVMDGSMGVIRTVEVDEGRVACWSCEIRPSTSGRDIYRQPLCKSGQQGRRFQMHSLSAGLALVIIVHHYT